MNRRHLLALSCGWTCFPAVSFGAVAPTPGSLDEAGTDGPASLPAAASSPMQADGGTAIVSLKAEYLYQFLGYVEFPRAVLPQPDSPLVIGVVGSEEVFNALARTLPSRAIGNRSVLRRRLSQGDSLAGVHLLFAGQAVDLAQNPLVKAAQGNPVLLVTDAPNGLRAGSIFNFLFISDQLRFEASLEAAQRTSLKVSSCVLALAERVIGGY